MDGIRERKKMSRKSIFTVVGGAALGLLIAAGILWVEPLAAEAEYVEEQEPGGGSNPPRNAAGSRLHERKHHDRDSILPMRKMLWSVFKRLYSHRSESHTGRDHRNGPGCYPDGYGG